MRGGGRLRLGLVGALLAMVLMSCSGSTAKPSSTKLVYGLTLAPSGLDPHVDVSSELGIPLNSVYDTLVYRTSDGRFLPMLAESWDVSPDGREYTFRLRRGIRFHDGTPFNAQAVKRTLDRVADPATGSRKALGLLGPYAGCQVLGDYTILVSLTQAFAPLLDSFSQVYLAPASPAALDRWGAEYQFHQVGTGPFRMVEYVPKDHVTLVRYEDYMAIPGIFQRDALPEVSEVEFRFLVEPAVRLMALQAHDADVVGEIPPQDAATIKEGDEIRILPVAIPGLPLVGFLNSAASPTDDPRVRRALLLATDRQEIGRTVFGGYSPVASGPLSHNHPDYDPGVEEIVGSPDPTAAAELLELAGWHLDDDGVRRRGGEELRLRAYAMSWGMVPQVAQLLQAQWQAVGVQMVVEEVTFAAALAAVDENQHNLIFWSEPGTDGDVLTSFFHSQAPGTRNWSRASSPEIDALLDQARVESDQSRRAELYAQVQRLVMEQSLIIPIRDYVNLNGVRSCVSDLHFDSRGWFPVLHDVRLTAACR